MQYIVQPGDSLWRVAERVYGDGLKWGLIARANALAHPDHLLVGQRLQLNDALACKSPARAALGLSPSFSGAPRGNGLSTPSPNNAAGQRPASIPAAFYVFVLADEINPFTATVVRRVLVNPKMAAEAARLLGRAVRLFPDPERFGFEASSAASKLSIGRHAMGMKPSPFLSASQRPLGATRSWVSKPGPARSSRAPSAVSSAASAAIADSIGLPTTSTRIDAMTNWAEHAPPWRVFPKMRPNELGATQGAEEVWLNESWRPFWSALSEDERQSYLDHWRTTEAWRESIRFFCTLPPDFDAAEDSAQSDQYLSARAAASPRRPSLLKRLAKLWRSRGHDVRDG